MTPPFGVGGLPSLVQSCGTREHTWYRLPSLLVGIVEAKEVYAFSPDHLTVYQEDTLDITIVNPEDDPHTFVLSGFNVNVPLPPQATTKVHFVANKVGVFTFLCDVASHLPFMTVQQFLTLYGLKAEHLSNAP